MIIGVVDLALSSGVKFQFTYWPPKLSKKRVEPLRSSEVRSSGSRFGF
jgi:hypothetical protein